jgi:ubiquinone/menaquinone biosynthesis methyltransferase
MATVREGTLDLLRELGMTTIFGNPGSTELPFLKEFPEDFTYVLGLQEASVLGMAEGYAQGAGNGALVNVHTAPGLGNAMGALVTAYDNKTPLVVTAGQQGQRHVTLEPLLTGKLVELAKPYVKRSHEPARAEDVPKELLRAYHTAMHPPKRPVFVSIPMDDWEAEAEPIEARRISHRSVPDPEALAEVAGVLRGARNPAIVTGSGVERSGAFYDAVSLAEKLRAPAWQEPISPLANFPQDHPLFRGHLAPAQKHLAEVKARRRKRQEGVCVPKYVQGDAMDLPFDDDSFDIVSIAFGIRNVSDPAKAIAEFSRVLRPGGRLVILEFAEPRNPIMRWGNRVYCKWIMPYTATLISRDRSGAYHYLPRSVETFLPPEKLCAMLREHGFDEPAMRPMTFGVCVAYCTTVSRPSSR